MLERCVLVLLVRFYNARIVFFFRKTLLETINILVCELIFSVSYFLDSGCPIFSYFGWRVVFIPLRSMLLNSKQLVIHGHIALICEYHLGIGVAGKNLCATAPSRRRHHIPVRFIDSPMMCYDDEAAALVAGWCMSRAPCFAS